MNIKWQETTLRKGCKLPGISRDMYIADSRGEFYLMEVKKGAWSSKTPLTEDEACKIIKDNSLIGVDHPIYKNCKSYRTEQSNQTIELMLVNYDKAKLDNSRIYCCGCKANIEARLTDGKEIYPHRKDLHTLPFWRCDACGNYVGCHHQTRNRTRPLGAISTPEIKQARVAIHRLTDALWKEGKLSRKLLYEQIGKQLGYEFHAGEIRSLPEANLVLNIVEDITESHRAKNETEQVR